MIVCNICGTIIDKTNEGYCPDCLAPLKRISNSRNRAFLLVLIFALSSCATKKKTILYSALVGTAIGVVAGKELSPNRESDGFNQAMGALSGAIVMGLAGNMMYEDRHPEKGMDISPIDDFKYKGPSEEEGIQLGDLGVPQYLPEIESSSKKKYYSQNGDYLKNAMKQYVIKHKTQEKSIILKNGKKYVFPEMIILEYGVENE